MSDLAGAPAGRKWTAKGPPGLDMAKAPWVGTTYLDVVLRLLDVLSAADGPELVAATLEHYRNEVRFGFNGFARFLRERGVLPRDLDDLYREYLETDAAQPEIGRPKRALHE